MRTQTPASMAGDLRASFRHRPPDLHVSVVGELDAMTADQVVLPADLEDLPIRTVLLHLRYLAFCDVSGVRRLLAFRDEQWRRGRKVVVADLHPNLRELFRLVVEHGNFLL